MFGRKITSFRSIFLLAVASIRQNVRGLHHYNLIPKLIARPEYQLSYDTKFAYELLLYLIWIRFFLNQPLLVMRSHGEQLSTTVKVVTA